MTTRPPTQKSFFFVPLSHSNTSSRFENRHSLTKTPVGQGETREQGKLREERPKRMCSGSERLLVAGVDVCGPLHKQDSIVMLQETSFCSKWAEAGRSILYVRAKK